MHTTIAGSMQHARPDDLDLDVASGIIADLRTQAGFLVRWLGRNQHIDRDLWLSLRDFAGMVLDESDQMLCVECLAAQKVKLGRGLGFDAVMCDACQRDEVGR